MTFMRCGPPFLDDICKAIELNRGQIMSQATVELSAIAIRKETQLFFQNSDRTPDTKDKLIAQWLRDEHAKLYCQWVMA